MPKQLFAAFRNGKVDAPPGATEGFKEIVAFASEAGSVFWTPPGWLAARRAAQGAAVTIRASFHAYSNKAVEEWQARLSLKMEMEDRDTHEVAAV
eukprot:367813-Alexandrium_andersonii.AAC.1